MEEEEEEEEGYVRRRGGFPFHRFPLNVIHISIECDSSFLLIGILFCLVGILFCLVGIRWFDKNGKSESDIL